MKGNFLTREEQRRMKAGHSPLRSSTSELAKEQPSSEVVTGQKIVYHRLIDGYWTSPRTVSEEDWNHILNGISENVKTMLYCYLQQPGYRGDELTVGNRYGIDWKSLNGSIVSLGMRARKYTGIIIHGTGVLDGQTKVWPHVMDKGVMKNDLFEFELRPELARAATRYLHQCGFVGPRRIQ